MQLVIIWETYKSIFHWFVYIINFVVDSPNIGEKQESQHKQESLWVAHLVPIVFAFVCFLFNLLWKMVSSCWAELLSSDPKYKDVMCLRVKIY